MISNSFERSDHAVKRIFVSALVCFFLVVASQRSAAQLSDIRGVVTDSVTGQRLPFVNVVLLGSMRGAQSNNAGFFVIPKVEPRAYELAASCVGYARLVLAITVEAGHVLQLTLRLAPRPVEQSEVVVTSQGKKELKEINTSIYVLDQKDMKLSPVTVQEDVFRAFQILPGIVSTSDVTSKFYVRGGAGDQNLVLLDGMRIYNPFHALGIFSVFDPDIVRTAEVYTGAYPAGFGGRLSSVVNLTSQDGRNDRLGGRAGINLLSSKVQLEGPAFAGTTWMFNARKSLFNQTFKNIVKVNTPVSFYDAYIKTSSQLSRGTKVDISALSTADELVSSNPDEPDYFWRNRAIGLTVSGFLGDRLLTNVTVYSTFFKAERDAKSSSAITPSSTSVQEGGIRGSATLYNAAHDVFLFGFEFDFPSINYMLINAAAAQNTLTNNTPDATLWIRYQTMYDRLQLDIGLQVDIGSIFFRDQRLQSLEPRLNMSYLFLGNWRGKVSYGRFNQTLVTATNEDDLISIFDPWIRVPDNLKPEQADHYVLGLEGNFAEAVFASAQIYVKDYNSLIAYNRKKVDSKDPDFVTGTGLSSGMELLLRAGLSFADLYGTYALSRTSINNDGFEYYPRYDRRHHINLLGVFHLKKSLDLTLRWEYGSGFPFTQSTGYYDRLRLQDAFLGPFELETGIPYTTLGSKNGKRLPAYHRLDVSAAVRFTLAAIHGTLGAQVMNVYDAKNVFYFDRKTGQRVDMLGFFPSATLTIEY